MKTFTYVPGLPKLVSLESVDTPSGRFYTTPLGNTVPSVTTVLGYSKRDVIQKWRNNVGHEEANKISAKASSRGTKLHSLCENYLGNKKILFENVMPDVHQAFIDIRPELDKIDNIHYLETPLYSESLGIAGRTDIIGEYNNILSVIDIKNSLKEKKEEWITNYFEQETAYSIMYEELIGTPIQQIVTIIAVEGRSEPQVFIKNRDDYIVSLLEKIYQYKKDHRNVVR